MQFSRTVFAGVAFSLVSCGFLLLPITALATRVDSWSISSAWLPAPAQISNVSINVVSLASLNSPVLAQTDMTSINPDVATRLDTSRSDATELDAASKEDTSKPASSFDPRVMLTTVAMKLRNIRYRRGGSSPKTGFDCSGFVRYVFQHSIGLMLPQSSAAQFHEGEKIDRHDMQTGDLVFFRIRGKRISHVGIYVDNGRFIHSPSSGKFVRIDSLDDKYWARRFAGAKRVESLASIDSVTHS
ncbi:MAG: C40 family peptidase [Dokdonella sp.]